MYLQRNALSAAEPELEQPLWLAPSSRIAQNLGQERLELLLFGSYRLYVENFDGAKA